jgi:NAD(P)-dependent dehydrogenase (short-subunit alcohol dehydrogenase family)
MELRGRVALVTGGGKRVGRAIAEGLGTQGMRVAVHYSHSADGAQETVATIGGSGGEARAFDADLRDAAAATTLVDTVADAFGGLDVVVNSAAVMVRTPMGEVTA